MSRWGRFCGCGASAAAIVASIAFGITGCAHDAPTVDAEATSEELLSPSTADAPPVSSQTQSQTTINSAGIPDGDWSGTMTAVYKDATSPEAVTGKKLLQSEHLLEDLADSINSSLKLPVDVPVIGEQCDVANAFWSPDDKTITICYEDAADALDIYTKAGDPDPYASTINSEIATFYHETGHMVISLYDLPTTGREEDVADQLAAYVLLSPGPDGKLDPGAVQAVKDFAREFEGYSLQKGGEIDDGQLADTHSLDRARMYNLECWVYGADPVGNADLVNDGLLPEDRADGCEGEYQKLSSSWDALLGPYLK